MARVILQVDGAEELEVRLARVPVTGDRIDFGEEFADEQLAGELFEVRSVIFPVEKAVDPDFVTQRPAEKPIVVLRRD